MAGAMDDKELERLAQEELLQEAKRAQERAEEMGPIGWQRCPLPGTNKRFLQNVLVSTLEPRKKKSRQAETKQCGTREKAHKPFHRDKDSKTTEERSKHKTSGKDKNKPYQNSSSKSRHKRKADRSPSFHHRDTSKRRTKP